MATRGKMEQTKVLAFDTSMDACSVAIWAEGQVMASEHENMRRGQAERLLVMIEEICEQARLLPAQFDYLTTTVGPGSFTGVRVALAAAKGLALVTGASVVPLTTCEAIAASAGTLPDGPLSVAIDARREQIYLQQFDVNGGEITVKTDPEILNLATLSSLQPDLSHSLLGSGRHILAEAWQNARPMEFEMSKAARFVNYSLKLTNRARPAREVMPLYLRSPDAKLPNAKG